MTEILRPGHDLVTLDRIQLNGERLDPRYVALLRRLIHLGDFRAAVERGDFDLKTHYNAWKEEQNDAPKG